LANLGKTLTSDDIRRQIGELDEELPKEDDPETREELVSEIALLQEVLESTHWNSNAIFIREDYFYEGFAEDYASGLGETHGWPYDYIDWGKAAIALRQDYVAVDILGDTYLTRS
jgi:hypothetical protein